MSSFGRLSKVWRVTRRPWRQNANSMFWLPCKVNPRERQVFVLIVRGKTNKQAAHELEATERTIKAYRRRVMEKMKTGSLAELVSIGERLRVSTHDDYYSRCNSMEISNPLLAGKRLA